MTEEAKTIDLSTIECAKVARVWFARGEAYYVYDPIGKTQSHDPMDRVGGPYRVSAMVNPDDSGDKWFLGHVVDDCYFPLCDIVRADSFEDAYGIYIDWCADHRHIVIEEPDLADYVDKDHPENGPECSFTSDGKPVNTDNIHIDECELVRIDFRSFTDRETEGRS
jgi:hypothetical protein